MKTHAKLEASFRHGLRVRLGPEGPKGVLLHCDKRGGGGKYWRVRLQSGEWIWPDARLIVDGPGADVATCASCDLPFMTVAGTTEICDRCAAEQFGQATRVDDPPPPAKRWNQRRRWR